MDEAEGWGVGEDVGGQPAGEEGRVVGEDKSRGGQAEEAAPVGVAMVAGVVGDRRVECHPEDNLISTHFPKKV